MAYFTHAMFILFLILILVLDILGTKLNNSDIVDLEE